MLVLSVVLSTAVWFAAATLSTAARATGQARAASRQVALIAGPINPGGSAGLNHYKMLVFAGEGGPPSPQTQSPAQTKPGVSKGASMWVVFYREANGAGAKVTIEQLYSFALPAGVLNQLGRSHRFDVGRALVGQKGYGVVNMQLASGKLKGLFHFTDVDGLSTNLLRSLPARILHGSLVEAIAQGHLPKTPSGEPVGCQAPGFAALTGFRMDASSGNEYSVLAVLPALTKPVTILASDLLNAKATAPATETREIVIPAAPSTAFTVRASSREGNAVNTGGATVEATSGFPYLSGDLSFGTEFSAPPSACYSTAGGTVAAGAAPPIAQFDPGDPGTTEVKLATTPQTNGDLLMRGSLITLVGG